MSIALPYAENGHDRRWEETYEELAYTAFALATQTDDLRIAALYTRISGVLADWERIEADRRRVRGSAIAARASVRVADAALDRALHEIGTTVLAEHGGERDAEGYKRFFPEPHEHVIELGLDGELPAAAVVMAELDEADGVSEELRRKAEPLRACLTIGNSALVQRAESYADLGRLSARVESWLEGAEAVKRTLRSELLRIAEEGRLGGRWAASFFADEV